QMDGAANGLSSLRSTKSRCGALFSFVQECAGTDTESHPFADVKQTKAASGKKIGNGARARKYPSFHSLVTLIRSRSIHTTSGQETSNAGGGMNGWVRCLLAATLLLTSRLPFAQNAAYSLAGRWTVTVDINGTPLDWRMELAQQGDKITGDFAGDKFEG